MFPDLTIIFRFSPILGIEIVRNDEEHDHDSRSICIDPKRGEIIEAHIFSLKDFNRRMRRQRVFQHLLAQSYQLLRQQTPGIYGKTWTISKALPYTRDDKGSPRDATLGQFLELIDDDGTNLWGLSPLSVIEARSYSECVSVCHFNFDCTHYIGVLSAPFVMSEYPGFGIVKGFDFEKCRGSPILVLTIEHNRSAIIRDVKDR